MFKKWGMKSETLEGVRVVNRLFLCTWFCYILYAIVLSFVRDIWGDQLPFLENIPFSLVTGQIAIIIPSVFYLIRKKTNIVTELRIKKIRPVTIFLLVLFTYASLPFIGLLNYISLFFSKSVVTDSLSSIIFANSPITSLLLIAFLPCLVEEIVFRGVLFQEYKKVSVKKAILLSAFLFGLFHMNINQFIYAFFMGLLFALLNEATDSILSSMIVHFVINGNSVIGQYLMSGSNEIKQNITASPEQIRLSFIVYGIFAMITFAFAILFYILIAKAEHRFDEVKAIFKRKKEKEKGSRVVTFPLLVVILLCLCFMLYEG